MKLTFQKKYFLLFILFISIEFSLLFTKGFIRHTFGDFLIVITIYCFLMSFVKTNYLKIAIAVLLFSFTIEFFQLTNFLEYLHLEKSTIAKTVLGNTFSIEDLIAYSMGILLIIFIEYQRAKTKNTVS